jgi:DMSO/TMAO reductase YedYZ heme-binding membrane subunit
VSLVLAAGGSHALWYATRGTGVIALVLLTATVWLGVAGARRFRSERWPRFLVVGLHRNLTLLVLVFLGLHVATTVADSYAPISLKDAVIPFTSGYRPVWLGLGAVAFDLLLALTVTSLLRARIGYRTWRSLHWLAYVSWPVALLHALGTGSDARVPWLQALAVAAVAAVGAAVAVRLRDGNVSAGRRASAGAAVVLVTLGIFGWYRTGPGHHGWAAAAGTPRSLLAPAAKRAAVRPAPVQASLPAAPFTARLAGRLTTSQDAGTGTVLVSIRGSTRGGARGVLWVRLQGEPLGDGGVSMTASGASFGSRSNPNAYVGKIVALEGTQMTLALRSGTGRLIDLRVSLRIDSVSHRVSGTVAALPGAGESQ